MTDNDADSGIARRKLLAAVAGAGGLGVTGGVGSAALLRDTESVGGLFQGGSVNLEVDVEDVEHSWNGLDFKEEGRVKTNSGGKPDYKGGFGDKHGPDDKKGDKKKKEKRGGYPKHYPKHYPKGSKLIKLWLPGTENNPARIWFQPNCPNWILGKFLELSIYYSNEDGDEGSLVADISGADIEHRSLGDLAALSGTKLQFDGAECLSPEDGPVYLLVKYRYNIYKHYDYHSSRDVGPLNEPQGSKTPPALQGGYSTNGGFGRGGSGGEHDFDEWLDFDVDFTARQCRNDAAMENPYPPRSDPCKDDWKDKDEHEGHDISWVAFCAKHGKSISDGDLDFSVDGDTLTLREAPDDLGTLVLKYSTGIRVFDHPETPGPSDPEVTFTTTDGGSTHSQTENAFDGSPRTNSDPCASNDGLKYEGDFDCPESKECK